MSILYSKLSITLSDQKFRWRCYKWNVLFIRTNIYCGEGAYSVRQSHENSNENSFICHSSQFLCFHASFICSSLSGIAVLVHCICHISRFSMLVIWPGFYHLSRCVQLRIFSAFSSPVKLDKLKELVPLVIFKKKWNFAFTNFSIVWFSRTNEWDFVAGNF